MKHIHRLIVTSSDVPLPRRAPGRGRRLLATDPEQPATGGRTRSGWRPRSSATACSPGWPVARPDAGRPVRARSTSEVRAAQPVLLPLPQRAAECSCRLFDDASVLECYRREREHRAPAGARPENSPLALDGARRSRSGSPPAHPDASDRDAVVPATAFSVVLGARADRARSWRPAMHGPRRLARGAARRPAPTRRPGPDEPGPASCSTTTTSSPCDDAGVESELERARPLR